MSYSKCKFYYLYQITNLINGKIYIGVHRTNNLDDGYMGSGKYLHQAYKEYGIENFKKEILEFFDSLEEMFSREAAIVTKDFLKREDTYNIVEGGNGRWSFEASSKGGKAAGKKVGEKCKQQGTGIFSEKAKESRHKFNMSDRGKEVQQLMTDAAKTKKANEKRKETLKRIKHQQGEKNSMYGTKWITNEIESTRIKKEDPIPEGWRAGRVIKQK